MGAVRTALAIAGIGLLVAACAAPRQTFERVVYGDPAKPYLGKTKTEIMTCAGTPAASFVHETTEVLTYHYNGAGPVAGEAKKSNNKSDVTGIFSGKKSDQNWKCVASLTFESDHLTHVTFAARDVESPYAKQREQPKTAANPATPKKETEPVICTFVLTNCGG